jgi:hypothetical protein
MPSILSLVLADVSSDAVVVDMVVVETSVGIIGFCTSSGAINVTFIALISSYVRLLVILK